MEAQNIRMKIGVITMIFILTVIIKTQTVSGAISERHVGVKLRSKFLQTLLSRRSEVPLVVEVTKPVQNSTCLANTTPPRFDEIMEPWAKEDLESFRKMLIEENLYLSTEEGDQGWLPVLILSMKERKHKKRAAVVILHGTTKCKEWLRPLLEAYASQGYVAIAIDSRYHGERAKNTTTYQDALVQSWKNGDTMPYIYDTTWDLIKLNDYLAQRKDIDHSRIGITGGSLGGSHAWFAAFVDTRYSVAVPVIGVQGFRWAIDNDKWQPRIETLKRVFSEAAFDLGKTDIDKEVVEKVVGGAEDPRCPIGGLETPVSKASNAYAEAKRPGNFEWIAQPGIGHEMTPLMVKEESDWFKKFLLA